MPCWRVTYGGLAVTPSTNGRQPITVSFIVRNTGDVTGTATPQVYLTLPVAAGEPGRRLIGFSQVTLRPGQVTRVRITIDPDSATRPLSSWNTARGSWAAAPGRYTVQVGSSSADLPLARSLFVG